MVVQLILLDKPSAVVALRLLPRALFATTLEALTTMRYAARVTAHGSGRVTIRVPDVPGVITYGDTEAEAVGRAQRLVLLLIRQLMIDGLPVPLPSTGGDVWIDLPADDGAAIERYSAAVPSPRDGLRSLMATLLSARPRTSTPR